jgi:hypothetical protein
MGKDEGAEDDDAVGISELLLTVPAWAASDSEAVA